MMKIMYLRGSKIEISGSVSGNGRPTSQKSNEPVPKRKPGKQHVERLIKELDVQPEFPQKGVIRSETHTVSASKFERREPLLTDRGNQSGRTVESSVSDPLSTFEEVVAHTMDAGEKTAVEPATALGDEVGHAVGDILQFSKEIESCHLNKEMGDRLTVIA